ncbi:hypothetical protein GCM10010243_19130 [Streptomyces matensis]|nr:hypothetical protein GCM10010243_19130 [Streptomyces matensis]
MNFSWAERSRPAELARVLGVYVSGTDAVWRGQVPSASRCVRSLVPRVRTPELDSIHDLGVGKAAEV